MNPRWIERPLKRGASAARVIFASAARVILEFLRVVYRGEDSEPAPEAAPKTGPMKVFWKPWLMTVGLLLVLWILDPIDVASNSARASAELFYRIISPAYEAPTALENAGSNNPLDDETEIAVIVINDDTLRRKDVPWPPPFSVHAEVIEKVLLYNPKALFIDFGFFDERDKEERGKKELERLTAALRDRYKQELTPQARKACYYGIFKPKACEGADWRVPVFCGFAETINAAECEGAVWRVPVFLAGAPRSLGPQKALYQLGVIPQLQNEVTGTVSTRYSTEHELPYNSYPLNDCVTGQPSAALAMYATVYDDWDAWGLNWTPCPGNAQREERDREGGPNKLSVYWASWGDAGSSRGSYECKTLPASWPGRAVQVVWNWGLGLFQHDISWREQFQACPPHRSYAAHDFLEDKSAELAEFMDDRYVFYGGNFAMADDLIIPPTHEPVPGVFLHAMALDNLIRRGGGYIRVAGNTGLGSAIFWLTILAILLVGSFTVLAWNGFGALIERPERQAACGASPEPPSHWSRAEIVWDRLRPIGRYLIGVAWVLISLLISVALVLAIVYFSFSYLNLAPFNFVGILAFLGIHTVVTSARGLFQSIGGG